jgi:XTP/dITP diphosphohydrolase
LKEIGTAENRAAQFMCAAVAVRGEHSFIAAVESVEGDIIHELRGTGGFGYDPLFLVGECGGRTMAELSDDEKNRVSHRGKAFRALARCLS